MSSANRLTWGLALSGAGHPVHNIQEFGVGIIGAWETLLPVAVTVVLIVAVRLQIATGVVLVAGAWGMVVLVAGGGSVFPLSALPFEPEQSAAHYVTHAGYALLQGPLLVATAMALAELRRPHGSRTGQVDRPVAPDDRSWPG